MVFKYPVIRYNILYDVRFFWHMIFLHGGYQMLRRMLCLLCCALLLLPALGMAEDGAFVMAGFNGEDSTHDWNTNQFFVRMQERTGLTFTFQQYNKESDWTKAKNAMFADGADMPDVLFKAALTTQELISLTDSGKLIDLAPLLPEHAPNLWQLLQENPDWLKAITLPSGKIGALPGIQPSAPQNAMWINKSWLDKLKLDMPADLDSLKAVLTAFRDRDPNGNGKQDEVPMMFLGPWELKFFAHAFGVVANDYNIYLDEAGAVHYWPMEDSFIELARTLRDFYAEGLLDPSGFVTADTLRRVTDDEATITYGAMFAPTPVNLLPYDAAMDYVMLEPLVYEGKQVYRDLFGQITRGTFAITSACEEPAALLRWVDVLYTEEGAIEAMVGIQDEDYEFDEDGLWEWVGGVESMSMEKLTALSVYDTGEMPWCFPKAFYDRYADEDVRRINAEMDRLNELAVKPFPTYTLTAEETQYVMGIQQKLGTYVDESLARFVLGEVDITDETVAQFRQGLSDRGMDDVTAFWQEVAQRP